MKSSEWLRKAAERFDAGQKLGADLFYEKHDEALPYIVMTLPLDSDPAIDIDSSRVMRFLLAAAIAEGEGN